MSHFSVLVVTAQYPSDAVLKAALQPYHEYECTGVDDEYVIDVDKTEEAREAYASGTTRRLRDPAGGLHDPWDDVFYRDPTLTEQEKIGPFGGSGSCKGLSYVSRDWRDGQGYRVKVRFVPDGWAEIDVPVSEVQSFEAYAREEYGEDSVRGQGDSLRVIDRTNPNAKWDWWQLGGRWQGMLTLKGFAAPQHYRRGSRGIMGSHAGDGVDVARKGDINLEGMKEDAAARRRSVVDAALARFSGALTKDEVYAQHKAAAEVFAEATRAWEGAGRPGRLWDWFSGLPDSHPIKGAVTSGVWGDNGIIASFMTSGVPSDEPDIDAWVNRAPALSAYALLRGGVWTARGEMGWFGMSSDERGDWDEALAAQLDAVPDDHWIAVVDCHI